MQAIPEKNSAVIKRYIVPQMLGLASNAAYLIVDGVFIGMRLGPAALAAAGVAVPALEFMIAWSMLLSAGTGILIATRIGRGKPEEARAIFNTSLVFTLLVSLGMAAASCVFVQPLARLLGATPTALADTVAYLRTFAAFSPFLVLSFSLSTYARNNGRPGLAMVALTVGSAMNILLDWLFMYPLNMGITGAALATGLGPVVSVLILLPSFRRRSGGVLTFQRPRRQQRLVRDIFAGGLPAFVAEFSIGLVTLLYNHAIVSAGLGDEGLAAYLVIGYAALIGLTAFLGAGEGVQPVLGYLAGAGDTARARALLRASLWFIGAVAAVLTAALLLFGEAFFALFLRSDPDILRLAVSKGRIYFLCLVPAGLNIVAISALQCAGRSGRALAVSLARCVGFVAPLLWMLPRLWPQNGLWAAVAVAECATVALAVVLSRSPERRGAFAAGGFVGPASREGSRGA